MSRQNLVDVPTLTIAPEVLAWTADQYDAAKFRHRWPLGQAFELPTTEYAAFLRGRGPESQSVTLNPKP